MIEMTSKERMDAALGGSRFDRVPVADLSAISAVKTMGCQMKDLRFDVARSVKVALDFNRMIRSDVVSPLIDADSFYLDLDVDMSEANGSRPVQTSTFFPTPEDVDIREPYDPLDPAASRFLRRGITDKVEMLCTMKPSGLFTTGWTWGPFSVAGVLRGIDALLMDIMTEPELARKVIIKSTTLIEGVISLELDTGNDGMFIADPAASTAVISRETYEGLVAEYTKKVLGKVRSYDAAGILHIGGDSTPMLDIVPDLGADCFTVDHMMDIAVVKKAIGDRVTIMGNIHPVDELEHGTTTSVMEASRRCIEKASDGGRFILSPGCEVPRDTPIQNVKAMIEASKQFSTY
jgi:MtaA/CmuA family methyltransferase